MSTKNTLQGPVEGEVNLQKDEANAIGANHGVPEMDADSTEKKPNEEKPEQDRKFYNIISTF